LAIAKKKAQKKKEKVESQPVAQNSAIKKEEKN
jgi:hypothetical protein